LYQHTAFVLSVRFERSFHKMDSSFWFYLLDGKIGLFFQKNA